MPRRVDRSDHGRCRSRCLVASARLPECGFESGRVCERRRETRGKTLSYSWRPVMYLIFYKSCQMVPPRYLLLPLSLMLGLAMNGCAASSAAAAEPPAQLAAGQLEGRAT